MSRPPLLSLCQLGGFGHDAVVLCGAVPARRGLLGLLLQLSRLDLWATGIGPAWPETTGRLYQQILWRELRYQATLEIRNRRATGFAVTVKTDRWVECAAQGHRPGRISRQQRGFAPGLYKLYICTEDPAVFQTRGAALVRAAAKACSVAPAQFAWRGPLDENHWRVAKRFAQQGKVRLMGSGSQRLW